MKLSIVVPIYNEEGNVRPLWERVTATLSTLDIEYELIFVNDCSTDDSEARLTEIADDDARVRVLHFRRNCGQTAALMAGFDTAQGEILIAMDGDLQNPPEEIPRLLEKIDEGYDVVSGWRSDRQDPEKSRIAISNIANWIISRISGVSLHDYGCTLKAYRRSVIKPIRLYGEMHRFIPIYASWEGARVTEIPVAHAPRASGTSNYGMERIAKVILDLILIKFLDSYQTRPIHVFGVFGLLCMGVSFFSGLYAIYLKFFSDTSFIQTPLPLLVVMSTLIGCMSVLMGFLAELLVRIYYETQKKTTYLLRDPPANEGEK